MMLKKRFFVNKDEKIIKDISEIISEIKYSLFEFSNLKRLPSQIKIN